MIGFTKATTREEDLAAAEYFAQQPYPRRIKVVESKTAPKVRLQGGMHMAVPASEGGGQVPIPPARWSRFRMTTCGPRPATRACPGRPTCLPGTLNRGKQLAAKYQCATCHGANLEGIGPVPALAGRSPSYTMRQLFDMNTGARRGPWSELMKPIVTSMSVQDLAVVSAFAASTPAPTAARPTTTTAAR